MKYTLYNIVCKIALGIFYARCTKFTCLFYDKNVKMIFKYHLLTFLSGCGFNTISTNQGKVYAAWSNVLNQYQCRADLIPNFVETVKTYASHKQTVLTGIIQVCATINTDTHKLCNNTSITKLIC
ncbi:cytoplasmic membrane protein [Bartonella schoenbuchensis m07a]|uniref:Cytoplasmic membrane protein n=1 Tax=Bartonella schoenbuchensis m07a TaxID=1094496 RepID=N6VD86_9HYPH|nr:cytoplasmic membrane protein [Bartonella schoenbuchensis m07a]